MIIKTSGGEMYKIALLSELKDLGYDPYLIEPTLHLLFARAFTETEYLYNELVKYLDEHPELKP